MYEHIASLKSRQRYDYANRPEKLNALVGHMRRRSNGALEATQRSGIRVVVVTGAGRAFCAGDDVCSWRTRRASWTRGVSRLLGPRGRVGGNQANEQAGHRCG